METENTICHHGCHGKIIKSVGEMLPNIGVSVFTQTFVIKSITFEEQSKKGRRLSEQMNVDVGN